MNQNDLDTFTSRILNKLKEESEGTRKFILAGDLSIESYRKQTGFLEGLEMACQMLIEENRKFMKEMLND